MAHVLGRRGTRVKPSRRPFFGQDPHRLLWLESSAYAGCRSRLKRFRQALNTAFDSILLPILMVVKHQSAGGLAIEGDLVDPVETAGQEEAFAAGVLAHEHFEGALFEQ